MPVLSVVLLIVGIAGFLVAITSALVFRRRGGVKVASKEWNLVVIGATVGGVTATLAVVEIFLR